MQLATGLFPNTGVGFTGGTAVQANRVTGSLAGTANTPAPGDNSQPNTLGGPASGQCVGLV